MTRNKQIITRLLPFFASSLLVYVFWRQTHLLLLLYVCILSAEIFMGRDRAGEIKLAGWGILWGFILEFIGTKSGYHTFNAPDLMGIPLWLTVFWGYGFITAKRVSALVYIGSPFRNK